MTRDYTPNHAVWGLARFALEDLADHLRGYDVEVRDVAQFEVVVKATRPGERARLFSLKLTEKR